MSVRALRWGAVAVLLAGWEIATRTLTPSRQYMAPPSQVLTSGLGYVVSADALGGLWVTTVRFLAAFAIAAVAGVGLGLVLGRAGRLAPAARDVFAVFYALPLVPFYPVLVLWFGLGLRSEVAFGALHGVVPVVLVTMAAAGRVDGTLIAAARAMGASRWRTLGMVVLPAVVPDVIGALRVGAALSLLGVLLAELMISVDGVGGVIASLIAGMRGADLDAVILVVCAGAAGVNSALQMVEGRVSRWRG